MIPISGMRRVPGLGAGVSRCGGVRCAEGAGERGGLRRGVCCQCESVWVGKSLVPRIIDNRSSCSRWNPVFLEWFACL